MTFPNPYPITPLPFPGAGPFHLDVDFLPGSKSLTNRALLLAALAEGVSTLTNVLFADDTRVMMQALKDLGFTLDIDEPAKTVTVHGQGGKIPARQAKLFLGNAGTAMRFLTAAVCLGEPGSVYELRGIARMHQRPIGQLVEPLRQLGAPGMKIEYLENEGYPPLHITLPVPGAGTACGLASVDLTLQPTISSQFISALMQIGPLLPNGLILGFNGPVTSEPYVRMTASLMQRFGIRVEHDRPITRIRIAAQRYAARDDRIEPDASNASYFLAAGAVIPGGDVTITHLNDDCLQGDARFTHVLRQMKSPAGLRGIDIDLRDMPDMAQTLAVVALFAQGETVIRNVGNLRVKETDRIAALRNELTKLGAKVTVIGDDIHIVPPSGGVLRHADGSVIDERHPVVIDTYDDHRMAMSFAVAGLAHRPGGIRIADPACVNKTYPEFFDHLKKLHEAVHPGATPGITPGITPGVKR